MTEAPRHSLYCRLVPLGRVKVARIEVLRLGTDLLVDLRECVSRGGQLFPTRRGLSLRPEAALVVSDALRSAMAAAPITQAIATIDPASPGEPSGGAE